MMYLFRTVIFRLLCIKNRLFERGFSYQDQLPWRVLQAADAVLCVERHAEGGELARQKMEALLVELQLHPDLFVEMSNILQAFHQAVKRRRRATLVHPDDVARIFLNPGALMEYITTHR